MGGNAFPDLYTPRMAPDAYVATKLRIQTLLKKHFAHVYTPIEAPGKQDYGDVDFIVCEPLSEPEAPTDVKVSKKHSPKFNTEVVAAMVGAEHSQRTGSFDAWNFAIPWPETEANSSEPLTLTQPPTSETQPRYIQVDISVLSNIEDFHWMKFVHAHGDLNMIITLSVRRKSLRISEKGFFALIPEIVQDSPKLAEVFITKDVSLVLQFLGLDVARFWQPFASWDEAMDYAAQCRFHNPGHGAKKSEENSGLNTPAEEGEKEKASGEDNGKDKDIAAPANPIPETQDPLTCVALKISNSINAAGTPSSADVSTPTEAVKLDLDLKATDKKRKILRPMYRYWIDEYLPAHVDEPARSAAHLTKQETLAEAKEFFGRDFADSYEKQRSANMKKALEPKLWKAMREFLNEQSDESSTVTAAFKGWKRELMGDADEKEVDLLADGVGEARAAFTEMRYAECLDWGKKEWEAILKRQSVLDKAKSDAGLRAKLEKEASISAAAAAAGEAGDEAGEAKTEG